MKQRSKVHKSGDNTFPTASFFLYHYLHSVRWFQSSEACRYRGHGFNQFYQKCGKLLLDGPERSGRWAFKVPGNTVPRGSGWGCYYLAYHSSHSPLISHPHTMYHTCFSLSRSWILLKWRLPWLQMHLPSTRTREFHSAKTEESANPWI